jgi:hypothetical protein
VHGGGEFARGVRVGLSTERTATVCAPTEIAKAECATSSALIAPTTRSSIQCTQSPTCCRRATSNCATGKNVQLHPPTLVSGPSDSSRIDYPLEAQSQKGQSVTNPRDEYASFPVDSGMCYNRRAVNQDGKQEMAPGESWGAVAAEPPTGTLAASVSAAGTHEDPSRYCPVCSQRLESRRCKLVCGVCGYYMSCADYY